MSHVSVDSLKSHTGRLAVSHMSVDSLMSESVCCFIQEVVGQFDVSCRSVDILMSSAEALSG